MFIFSSIVLLCNLAVVNIDTFITEFMEQNQVPGLSACIVVDSEILWSGAWGFQHIENQILASASTVYMMASVSKTFTGTALMQLWEDGLFELDDSVSDYLPFSVTHVSYPETPITFQMILTHSSGIKDNWDVMGSVYHAGDSPIPLYDFLYSYYTPGEPFYDPDKNFFTWEPGTHTSYSNMAYALMGLLVQEISGLPFDEYCNQNIFEPLGMDETSWFFADLDSTHIAMPYHWDGDSYIPYGYFGYADYPAGQLRTSAAQLAIWLSAFLNNGSYNDFSLLDSTTVDMITTLQNPDISSAMGLTWFRRESGERVFWEHGGADQGVKTKILFNPTGNYGIVALTNGNIGPGPVVDALLDHADLWVETHGSLFNIFETNRVFVTPNPVNDTSSVMVELSKPDDIHLELFDLSGRKVTNLFQGYWDSGLHSIDLDMSNLPSGIFYIRLTSAEENLLFSFISI